MKFDINNYRGKYVMHCKTEKEAKEFCDYLHSIGMHWSDGFYKYYTHWKSNAIETCCNFNEAFYASKNHYIKQGFTILEWSDFTTEFTKADLKDGMIVELVNGIKYLVLGNLLVSTYTYLSLDNYTDDLKHEAYAISAVYKANACSLSEILKDNFLTLIWERKEEPVEMTLAEVCKALGKEIKIVKE